MNRREFVTGSLSLIPFIYYCEHNNTISVEERDTDIFKIYDEDINYKYWVQDKFCKLKNGDKFLLLDDFANGSLPIRCCSNAYIHPITKKWCIQT